MNRREFGLAALTAGGIPGAAQKAGAAAATGSHIGNLYPFVQKQADRAPIELSFLRAEFRDLKSWQKLARAKVFEHMFYTPPPVEANPQVIRRTDRGDYVEEYLAFSTTPDLRVPAYVLIPKNTRLPAPGIVALHDHGGFYLWGKEKLIQLEGEHPVLTEFRQKYYGGKSTAVELVRQGYVVAVIDMFYWGERRMILDDDPFEFRERPSTMAEERIREFNRRSSQNEQLVARSMITAGITWPGVMLWDDIRTLDYLASRPEVDRRRLGCVGLSVGGYRTLMLSALDERIRVAVSVGFMQSHPAQIRRNVINSTGLTFHLIGLLRYLDLPDLSALIAPRPIMFINGSRDGLFNQNGLKAAYEIIARCYTKAGVTERQVCRLYDAPHEFNSEMQAEAWQWVRKWI
ncbi:MAG: dienelactone hydrolase family protein [Bryobacterales bacterium]|nr:dienelactone hydrolase family protein [Bryobacterales bacterium]